MRRISTLLQRVSNDWPRWAQVGGMLLGTEQVVVWVLGGPQPNLGAMTFAGALLMFQRAVSAQQKRTDKRNGNGGDR